MLLHLIRKCGGREEGFGHYSEECGGRGVYDHFCDCIHQHFYLPWQTHAWSSLAIHRSLRVCGCVGGGRGWGLRTFCGRCNAQIKYFIPEQSFRQVVQ